MFDCVFQPSGQSDTDVAQGAAFDSLSGMILHADQGTFEQQGLGRTFCHRVANSHSCVLPFVPGIF